MSYSIPKQKAIPIGQSCQYGDKQFPCNNEAKYYIKSTDQWCCEQWVANCPGQKARLAHGREKKKEIKQILRDTGHINFDLEHIRLLYPNVYLYDVTDSKVRYNKKSKRILTECTNSECKMKWFEPTQSQLGLREWALNPNTQGGTFDGYRMYCSDRCKKECPAFGKSGETLLRDIERAKMIDWDEEEWYGGSALPSERTIWRDTCLDRDDYQCQRCGSPAEHVHHIYPIKTHPESELDPVNGISVCKECHYSYFHKKGTECSLPALAGKTCYAIVNGEKKRLGRGNTIYVPTPGILTC